VIGDYEHLQPGWREVCELLAGIRDTLNRKVEDEIADAVSQARRNW
jgi:hypothetical protein